MRNEDMWINEIFALDIFSDPEAGPARDRAFEAAEALAKSGHLTHYDLLNLHTLIGACCNYGVALAISGLKSPATPQPVAEEKAPSAVGGVDRMREAIIRACAEKASEAYRTYVEPTQWDYGAQDACTKIERTILALATGATARGPGE